MAVAVWPAKSDNKSSFIRRQAIPKKQTVKVKVTAAEPFGQDFDELSNESFREAVEEVWERQQQKGQDSYGTMEGELAAVKPDGRVEPVEFNGKITKG